MIILLSLWVFWFVELSTIPFKLMKAFDYLLSNFIVRNALRLINCVKCLGFWTGLGYGLIHTNIFGAILLAGICSLVAIVAAKIWGRLND